MVIQYIQYAYIYPSLPRCLYVHKSEKGGKPPRVLYQHTSYQTLAYARLPSQAHILSSTFSNSSTTKPLKLFNSQSTLPPHRTARSLQNYLHMRLGALEPYIKFTGCWHSHTFWAAYDNQLLILDMGCFWWGGLLRPRIRIRARRHHCVMVGPGPSPQW